MNYKEAREELLKYSDVVIDKMQDNLKQRYAKQAHLNNTDLKSALEDEMYDNLSNIANPNLVTDKDLAYIKRSMYRAALYYANAPMVSWLANSFYKNHRNCDYAELYDQARLGLVRAMKAFDPDKISPYTHKPNKFTTFAFIVVQNSLRQAINKYDKASTVPTFQEFVRSPVDGTVARIEPVSKAVVRIGMGKYAKKVKKVKDRNHKLVEHFYNVIISDQHSEYELSFLYHLRFKVGDVVDKGDVIGERSNFGLKVDSLDRPIGEDKDGNQIKVSDRLSFSDLSPDARVNEDVSAERKSELWSAVKLLKKYIDKLDPIDRQILYLRYPVLNGHPEQRGLKQWEVGERLGLSQPKVSKRERDTIDAIQTVFANQNLSEDLF